MSQTITLYVDGACKGNPGLGGWGAYVITQKQEHKLCGGEPDTTNNRMELTAAIEGVAFCPMDAKLVLWTDSIYVKRGITEWIHGWKKKNWKDVKNPDLWKKLDAVCQNREIEWNWVKGHAGNAGNEMADQLANLGVEQTIEKMKNGTLEVMPNTQNLDNIDKKKEDKDWLLDDPFGFDLIESDLEDDESSEDEILSLGQHTLDQHDAEQSEIQNHELSEINKTDIESDTQSNEVFPEKSTGLELENAIEQNSTDVTSADFEVSQTHPHIVITPATLHLQGPRQLILDTETTGFYFQDSDRIVEVGALEMINRKLTGSSIHIYINPERLVGDSENIHGISDQFLKDKPKYDEIAQVLYDYLKGSEIIAHNASFDMNFLDMEFKRSGFVKLSEVCSVTDTLAMAKNKHPGQKNSLNALVRRYEIPERDRTFHGALLDAEILADVYLAMTGGQVSLDIDASSANLEQQDGKTLRAKVTVSTPVIFASEDELAEHEQWIKKYQEKHGKDCFFAQ